MCLAMDCKLVHFAWLLRWRFPGLRFPPCATAILISELVCIDQSLVQQVVRSV